MYYRASILLQLKSITQPTLGPAVNWVVTWLNI